MYGYQPMKKRKYRRTFEERTGFPLKLLQPGYSGELSPEELDALMDEIKRNSKVRKRWGFESNERVTKKRIKEMALQEGKDE